MGTDVQRGVGNDLHRARIAYNLDVLWLKLHDCAERIRHKGDEARLEMRLAQAEVNVKRTGSFTVPAGPHVTRAMPLLASSTSMPIHVNFNPHPTCLEDLWAEWKQGYAGSPPIEQLNAVYGRYDWVRRLPGDGAKQALIRSKIIDEMEFHLSRGRKIAEVLVAGNDLLQRAGSFAELARIIRANQDRGVPTFFDPQLDSGSD